MRSAKLAFRGDAAARFFVASRTRVMGVCGCGEGGLLRGTDPVCYGGSLAMRRARSAGLIREGAWQGNFDAGVHFGDAPGNLDQAQADGVELGVAPERGSGRQAAQGQHQPISSGVDQ